MEDEITIKIYEYDPGMWAAQTGKTTKVGSTPKESLENLIEYLDDNLEEA